MTDFLASALIATLASGGLAAAILAWARTRLGIITATVLGFETLVLGISVVLLSLSQLADRPWLDVPLRHLALQTVGFGGAVAVFGLCFFLISRLTGGMYQPKTAVLVGLLIPLAVTSLMVGIHLS